MIQCGPEVMAVLRADGNRVGAKAVQSFQCCYNPTRMNRSCSSGAVAVRWEGNGTSSSSLLLSGGKETGPVVRPLLLSVGQETGQIRALLQ